MPRIVRATWLNDTIVELVVDAPRIASKGRAGQFVMVMASETGERIPLTLADMDPAAGTITLVFQLQGKTSLELSRMRAGDEIAHVTGPLGKPTELGQFGTVVMLGGGCGVAPVHAQAKALKACGNTVISILGYRTAGLAFWANKMAAASDRVITVTDDGSSGFKGFTTTVLQDMLDRGEKVDRVIAIGPLVMMANAVKVTKPRGIPTIVSLNTLMVDGTGMCGACRVTTSSGVKFSCMDGPDMDGFDLDFEEILARNKKFAEEEAIALRKYEHECKCGRERDPGAIEKCN